MRNMSYLKQELRPGAKPTALAFLGFAVLPTVLLLGDIFHFHLRQL